MKTKFLLNWEYFNFDYNFLYLITILPNKNSNFIIKNTDDDVLNSFDFYHVILISFFIVGIIGIVVIKKSKKLKKVEI